MSVTGPNSEMLRGFLLGTLTADHARQVQEWLEVDPAHTGQLDALIARDPLLDAMAARSADDSAVADIVDRVIRRVSHSFRTPSPEAGDTPWVDSTGHVGVPPNATTELLPREWPPTRLGEYRVVREVGRGGMGVVLEVADEKLGRRVAVKVLHPDHASRADAVVRFKREAKAAAALEHENVVPILHIGEEDGLPYLVMPLLKGESLSDRLKRDGKLPVAEAVRVGRDLAAGLSAAHAVGLVHRDMKPGNVWLDAGTGRARVLDFGLARRDDEVEALTRAGALVGTPAYMAPEQLDGHPATTQSDAFALGAILYECVTGNRAFGGPTLTAVMKAVSEHTPPAPAEVNPDVSPALSALIMQLLAKKPDARPASVAAVHAALSAPLDAATAPTATWNGPAVAPARQGYRKALWISGAVVLVLIAAVAVWFATQPSPSVVTAPPEQPPPKNDAPRYRGKVDVKLARTEKQPLVRLTEQGVLPMRQDDTFRIEGEVQPPAYVYVLWVDPDHDITPVYPWNPGIADEQAMWNSRPAKEEPVGTISLPTDKSKRYTASDAKPGVATMVLFASPTPLAASNEEIKNWFKRLPELPLPAGGEQAAVWFDDYAEVKGDQLRLRAGFGQVTSAAPFERWQDQLRTSLSGKASFQTAVSFARVGRK